jgi:hypothetical protein
MTTFTAVVIELPDEDGETTIRKLDVDKSDNDALNFLQLTVGGYIEVVYSEDGKTCLWMNEEGKLNGLEINFVATEILYELHPAFAGHDVLVGRVVLTGNRGPNTTSIPAGLWDRLKAMPWDNSVKFVEVANA